jgi:hypothetical protein
VKRPPTLGHILNPRFAIALATASRFAVVRANGDFLRFRVHSFVLSDAPQTDRVSSSSGAQARATVVRRIVRNFPDTSASRASLMALDMALDVERIANGRFGLKFVEFADGDLVCSNHSGVHRLSFRMLS